jgi:hypothetical protein
VLKDENGAPDSEATAQKEVMRAFKRNYEAALASAAAKAEQRRHEFDSAGLGPAEHDLFEQYVAAGGYEDVEDLYNRGQLRPGTLTSEGEAKLSDYRRWLYKADIPASDEHEPINQAAQALGETTAAMQNELTVALEARRRRVLPAFLKQFNKVQDKNLNVAESLNLVRNESTFSKQEISYMEKTSSRVRELLNDQENLQRLIKQRGSG